MFLVKLIKNQNKNICFLLLLSCFFAESYEYNSTFTLSVGQYFPKVNSTIGVSILTRNAQEQGKSIDLEDFLLLEDTKRSSFIDFEYRLNENHFFSLLYFDLNREASVTYGGNNIIQFELLGDTFTINPSETIKSELNFSIIEFLYGYTLFDNKKHHLAVTAGIHSINAEFTIQSSLNSYQPEQEKAFIPVPNAGFLYDYRINQHWDILTGVQWLNFQVDKIGGKFIQGYAGTRYHINQDFSVDLAYVYNQINIKETKYRKNTNVDIQYQGPQINFSYHFM